MTDTPQRVEEIFREAMSIDIPSPTTDIIAAGILDSLMLVTLLFEIEQRFQITIPLDGLDIEGLRTVESIAALVDSLS